MKKCSISPVIQELRFKTLVAGAPPRQPRLSSVPTATALGECALAVRGPQCVSTALGSRKPRGRYTAAGTAGASQQHQPSTLR